ncbi:MAG: hypothetical protein LRY73_17220 [Bacillus sp. (in: Bacteria)]|nr:hypothetical protein [Bacillus sp. (in: firmicutes)]
MNFLPIIILSGIICIFALIATIVIGINPNDENYVKTTKSRMILLTVIYIVTFIPAIIFTLVYFVW